MLRFFFKMMFFSMLLLSCGKHDLIDDGYMDDENEKQLLSSSGKISSSGTSSSSSGGESPVSSSDVSSSSLHEELSSSSSAPEAGVCDFSETSYVNWECFYDETVLLEKNVLFGSQARLHFAKNASLRVRGDTLKINKGAKLYFGENSELLIESWGSLDVCGEEEMPVVFAAVDENKPWKGIRILTNAQLINIKYADLSSSLIGIDFGKSSVLKNSKIHDNEYGIKQNSPFSAGNFSGNNFYSNVYDAGVSLEVAATLGSPEQFDGKLHVSGYQDIEEAILLPGFAYFVDNMISVKSSLAIDAGAHFYFSENSYIKVWTGGNITAIGTDEKPIIFGVAATNGFWGAVNEENAAFYFDGGCGEKSVFEYFEVLRAKTAFFSVCSEPVELSNGRVVDYRNKDFLTMGMGIFLKDDSSVTSILYTQE